MSTSRTVSSVGAVALIAAVWIIGTERSGQGQNINAEILNGSYRISITLNCGSAPPSQCSPGPYLGFVSYTPQGDAIANEIIPYPPPLNTATLTEDHGNWARIGRDAFAVTFVKLASVDQVAIATVRNRAIISRQGETFSGRFVTDIGSAAGTNYVVVGNGTITGQFISPDLAPPL